MKLWCLLVLFSGVSKHLALTGDSEEEAASLLPCLPSAELAGTRKVSTTPAGSMVGARVAMIGPPAPLSGVETSPATKGVEPAGSSTMSTPLPPLAASQVVVSTVAPLAGSVTLTDTAAAAAGAFAPGKKTERRPGEQAMTGQSMPPICATLLEQLVASIPALLMLTMVQPEVERVAGDTSVMDRTCRGQGEGSEARGERVG